MINKNSWRTTLAGIFVIVGTIAPVVVKGLTGDIPSPEEIVAVGVGVSAGVGLIKAKDAKVTGLPPKE